MHPASKPSIFRCLPLALFAPFFTGCTTTAVHGSEPKASKASATDAAAKNQESQKDEDSDPAEELDELRHGVGEAEWDLASAERSLSEAERSFAIWNEGRELKHGESSDGLAKARQAVHEAEKALQLFVDFDLPEETEDKALALEGSEFRVMQAQQELDQMASDYERFAGEEYADKTGQIVIDRSRQQLEFSRRRLEMTRKESEKVLQHEMPEKRRSLELELQLQRNELARAERQAEIARREEDGERMGKEAAIEKARHELENARRDLDLARKELSKAGKKKVKS